MTSLLALALSAQIQTCSAMERCEIIVPAGHRAVVIEQGAARDVVSVPPDGILRLDAWREGSARVKSVRGDVLAEVAVRPLGSQP